MKKLHYRFAALLCFILTISISACKKNDLDKQPLDALSSATFWTSQTNAVDATNNIYRFLADSWDRIFLSCGTDDSYSWSNWPDDIQYAGNGSATSAQGVFAHYWQNFYNMIGAANTVLDNIDKVTNMDATIRARLKGEARFLRAFAYQQLIGMYGDVPLVTTIPATADFAIARSPRATVAKFIEDELTAITNDVPLTYAATDQGRVTRGAVLALKARTYLYEGDWANAAIAAKAVMDLGQYQIDPNYLSLFDGTNKNSPEIILSGQFLAATYTTATATWVGAPTLGGWGQVVPLQKLVDAYQCTDGLSINKSPLYNPAKPFDNRDPRLKLTIVVPGTVVNGLTIDITKPGSIDALGKNNASFSGYYYKKYVPAVISGAYDSNSSNDIVMLRYAEVLLTYAEAKIEANAIDQTVYDAINAVRSRPGVNMPAVTAANASTQALLRDAVRNERHVEFPMEDQRLFDIRRWKIAETVMPGKTYGILNNFDASRADYGQHVLVETRQFNVGRDYLWAVPVNQLSLDKSLTQNPGW